MLIIKRKFFKEIWFSEKIIKLNLVFPVVYRQYLGTEDPKFFFKEKFCTLILNLGSDLESIKNNFSKETKYEIRRAEKENITFQIEKNKEKFIENYNRTADILDIEKLTIERLNSFKENLVITKSLYKDKEIIYHGYLKNNDRVRLLYSIRILDKNIENKIYGFANRYLHFKDIEFFKNQNIKYYDFGGIAKEKLDVKLENINKFKMSFGGYEEYQNNYFNLTMKILYLVRKIIK